MRHLNREVVSRQKREKSELEVQIAAMRAALRARHETESPYLPEPPPSLFASAQRGAGRPRSMTLPEMPLPDQALIYLARKWALPPEVHEWAQALSEEQQQELVDRVVKYREQQGLP